MEQNYSKALADITKSLRKLTEKATNLFYDIMKENKEVEFEGNDNVIILKKDEESGLFDKGGYRCIIKVKLDDNGNIILIDTLNEKSDLNDFDTEEILYIEECILEYLGILEEKYFLPTK